MSVVYSSVFPHILRQVRLELLVKDETKEGYGFEFKPCVKLEL